MNEENENLDQNINITLPIIVGYQVINAVLKEKLVGEIIDSTNKRGEKSNYARVLDVSIDKSNVQGFDLIININLQTLTSIFKNRQVRLFIHAALELDRVHQQVYLKDFEVDGRTKNWFSDRLLETVVNNWMYERLKNKMKVDLLPHIKEKMAEFNRDFENKLEAKEGVHILGSLDKIEISGLAAKPNEFWILVTVKGTGFLELTKLEF